MVTPLILGLFLILIAINSATKLKRNGEVLQPCLVARVGLINSENHPLFMTEQKPSAKRIRTYSINCGPKPKYLMAPQIVVHSTESNAFS